MSKSCHPDLKFVALLESGCQELEAWLKLLCIHSSTHAAQKGNIQGLIAESTTEALFHLCFVKTHALLFDTGSGVVSLGKFLESNPINSGTSELYQKICAVVVIEQTGAASHNARVLKIEEVRADSRFVEYNQERAANLKRMHPRIRCVYNRLSENPITREMKNRRDKWIAHTSLDGGQFRLERVGDQRTYAYLRRCFFLLRAAVRTYKPAIFVSEGCGLWQDLAKSVREASKSVSTH